jgi:hypothetical protein
MINLSQTNYNLLDDSQSISNNLPPPLSTQQNIDLQPPLSTQQNINLQPINDNLPPPLNKKLPPTPINNYQKKEIEENKKLHEENKN